MNKIFILAKNTIFVGALFAFIPIMVALYFLRDHIENPGLLLIRLSFIMGGLIIVYLVIKIIKKLIHHDEEQTDISTHHLVNIELLTSVTNRQILIGLGIIVGILFVSLVPSPWNIFLMLGGFYVMFTMMIRLA